MDSPVSRQLKRLREDIEQKEIKPQQVQELVSQLSSLDKVKERLAAVDFAKASTSVVLELLLAGAIGNHSSDIHFEPKEDGVRIRYRIDGVLNDITPNLPRGLYKALISRIKLLARLKIDVIEQPQDGRFSLNLSSSRAIELRISILPSEFGEAVVMRILDPEIINISLMGLGLREDILAIVLKEIAAPNGLILNTGPTGSGKTTTLYSFLKKRASPEIKIITIEDPIEYDLEGIEQTQVDPGGGYTFANGLASIMRQDPDVILVGEIRDRETAEIAIQAALTGHLVFSTVHANQVAGAIPRLLDLGVKPASIGPALNLIMAQRLVRRLCLNCRRPQTVAPDFLGKIKNLLENLPPAVDQSNWRERELVFYEPVGCAGCNQTGYKGRAGVFEALLVDEEAESLIKKEVSETELKNFALKKGMVTMQQDGIIKAVLGITSLAEVEAVTGSWLF